MKIRHLAAIAVVALFAGAASAAPAFPFPQNQAYPQGNTVKFASPSAIKAHFDTWKSCWYKDMGDGTARIISPNDSTEMSVSEGIAYGMLIMVYMSGSQGDYQSEFNKLWAFWKKYAMGGGASGMKWHVNTNNGKADDGSASDAEFDAAVALVMASKQWGDASYLSDAKSLISWIKSNDMTSDGSVKPGSNWNNYFNPSYSAIGAFHLFKEVSGDTFWDTAIKKTLSDASQCQDSKTGLVADWCDWSSHKPTQGNAAITNGVGFFDDACRTPWRMAWAYYWYGDTGAKAFNDKIVPWLQDVSYGHATYIQSGYKVDGTGTRDFVSSSFSGGLGLAMASATNPGHYMETVYETLINTEGRTKPDSPKGEKYYPATLNILYLLLMTGNMPNFYNMTGYTAFTPDQNLRRQVTAPAGTLLPTNSSTFAAGFWNWGAYSDKFGVTKMVPDSGSSAIYQTATGNRIAASMYIAPEPTYDATADLKYPFAGVAVSFKEDESNIDLSEAMSIKLRIRTEGVIRMALLNQATLENGDEGGEPGYLFHPSDDFQDVTISLAADQYGDFTELVTPSWAFPFSRQEILQAVRGIKFEAKMSKGGYGAFELTSLEVLDANGATVATLKGLTPIPETKPVQTARGLRQVGSVLELGGFGNGAEISVYNMSGKLVRKLNLTQSGNIAIDQLAPSAGIFTVKVKEGQKTQMTRIQK